MSETNRLKAFRPQPFGEGTIIHWLLTIFGRPILIMPTKNPRFNNALRRDHESVGQKLTDRIALLAVLASGARHHLRHPQPFGLPHQASLHGPCENPARFSFELLQKTLVTLALSERSSKRNQANPSPK